MSTETHSLSEYREQLNNNRLGLWLFFVSEAFLFIGLLAARFYPWGNTRPDLDQNLGIIVTVILLASSFSMNRAETAIVHNDRETFLNSLLVTASLGVIFLVGVVVPAPEDVCAVVLLIFLLSSTVFILLLLWMLPTLGLLLLA